MHVASSRMARVAQCESRLRLNYMLFGFGITKKKTLIWLVPNRVLMAHTEWLPGGLLKHSVPPVQDII